MVTMIGTVLGINAQSLLVRDESTGEQFVVRYRNPRAFSIGDRIRIFFSGQVTSSIPPQITAISIQRIGTAMPPTAPENTQMRGTITQRGNGFFIMRNTQGQLVRVDFNQANHFCVGRQVIVTYDSIMLTNPPRINATEVAPVC